MIQLPPNASVRLRTQRRLCLCTPPHRHTASSGIKLVLLRPHSIRPHSVAAPSLRSKQGEQPNMIRNFPANPGSGAVVRVTFFALLVAVAGIAPAQTAPGTL